MNVVIYATSTRYNYSVWQMLSVQLGRVRFLDAYASVLGVLRATVCALDLTQQVGGFIPQTGWHW